jgi:hypothetical protein
MTTMTTTEDYLPCPQCGGRLVYLAINSMLCMDCSFVIMGVDFDEED